MTKFTILTKVITPCVADTKADFAVAFGHNLLALPWGVDLTVSDIRAQIAPDFSIQKVTAYLRKAVAYGVMVRKEVFTGEYHLDRGGNLVPTNRAFYTRV